MMLGWSLPLIVENIAPGLLKRAWRLLLLERSQYYVRLRSRTRAMDRDWKIIVIQTVDKDTVSRI